MEQTGSAPVGGPNACPFVALEFDRDRRADRPDYRHRCYAEPTPAPRAIAHQDQYCLSPRFAACPIFQDWATRAAARPLPAHATGEEAAPVAEEAAAPETPAGEAAAPQEPAEEQQLAAFETPPPAGPEGAAEEGQAPLEAPLFTAGAELAEGAEPAPAAPAAPAAGPGSVGDSGEVAEPAAPAFLSGRSARPAIHASAKPPSSGSPSPAASEQMRREDVVPSWEIDGRYGAQEPRQRDGRGQQIMTFVAVVVILALGVAAVFIIPGLLAGGPGASPSSQGSVPPGASASATSLSSLEPTLQPSPTAIPSLTPTPTPEVTFRTYRVKKGDTLLKIARHFKVNVDDILAANPQITDPNHIEPGQTIVIPQPAPSASP
jgi:LysM repeat protein